MSRGLGRRERQLLHAVYAHPRFAPNGRRYVWPAEHAVDRTEYASLQRAARSLLRKGLVKPGNRQWANDLEPLPDGPVSDYTWAECSTCEHIADGFEAGASHEPKSA
jgi:hypothetical protein